MLNAFYFELRILLFANFLLLLTIRTLFPNCMNTSSQLRINAIKLESIVDAYRPSYDRCFWQLIADSSNLYKSRLILCIDLCSTDKEEANVLNRPTRKCRCIMTNSGFIITFDQDATYKWLQNDCLHVVMFTESLLRPVEAKLPPFLTIKPVQCTKPIRIFAIFHGFRSKI